MEERCDGVELMEERCDGVELMEERCDGVELMEERCCDGVEQARGEEEGEGEETAAACFMPSRVNVLSTGGDCKGRAAPASVRTQK
jgi:hypothetical protein